MNNLKNKIAFKLIIYFSSTLILFSAIIGSIFMALFKEHTMNIYKTDMQNQAVTIADSLSNFMENLNKGYMQGGMMQNGMGAYIKSLENYAASDIWIVDENLNLITIGRMSIMNYSYKDLPDDADKVVKEVFKGSLTFSEGFSSLLNSPTLTVGTPIVVNSQVVGAVLLHSPVSGINSAVNEGFKILSISIITALLLSIVLSVIIALSFTKPLKKMKTTALMLVDGNYEAKTHIVQKDEIGELASTLDILAKRLNKASENDKNLHKLRQDFIANISHELRTPVTVIRGSLEALCDDVVSSKDKVKEYHLQMLKESKYLQRLVNDLLDLSKLQNTDFKIEMDNLNLSDVLSDVIRSSNSIAEIKNIKINFTEDTEVYQINGDYGRLRQMFLIILDNAIKFSPNNSFIDVSLFNGKVTVKDSGIGISDSDLPYIFERFYKSKNEGNKNGTGLGLAIAIQIAERHSVKVTVNSSEGKGTEFIFEF